MSTLNIDEETRKSKFADCKEGELVTITLSGTVSAAGTELVVDVDNESIEYEPAEEEEEPTKPPPAVTAAVKAPSKGKTMPMATEMAGEEED